jgi:hypothetical protein
MWLMFEGLFPLVDSDGDGARGVVEIRAYHHEHYNGNGRRVAY